MVFAVVLFAATRISHKIGRDFSTFTRNLQHAVDSGSTLLEDDYALADISQTIGSINTILAHRLQAEKSLETSEARFRTIVENIPVMILVLDAQAEYRSGNNEALKYFSLQPYTGPIAYLQQFLTDSPDNRCFQPVFSYFDKTFRELELRTRQGIRSQNWAAFKTHSDEIILVGYDVTKNKQVQRRLIDLNKAKDKFFSIISHDLRSPFSNIIGCSDLLMEDYATHSDAERRELIEQINSGAVATLTLLDNLLNWARTQAGTIEPHPDQFNLHALLNTIFDVLNPSAQSKGVQLVNAVSQECYLFADQDMINTTLYNLIANSIKFTRSGDTITITAVPQHHELVVAVADTGIGMPQSMADSLFSLAEPSSRQGTNSETGTGLGLMICKEFVEKMGGKIWLTSEENAGTTFFFSLNQQTH